MTKAEQKHLGRVAALGCIVCDRNGYPDSPAEIHHIRTNTGAAKRASHFDTIPLCPHHHRGAEGVHGMGRKAWERHIGLTELDLLDIVKARLP